MDQGELNIKVRNLVQTHALKEEILNPLRVWY